MTPSLTELVEQFSRAFPPTPSAATLAAAPAGPTGGSAPTAAAPSVPPDRVHILDYAIRGYQLEVHVEAGQVVQAATLLDQHGFALDTITGVDWLAEGQMEVVYDYFHPEGRMRVAVRARMARENPELPTILHVFPGANWHERETHDFFGIRFLGHPDLTPLLLPEDATGHPLRKDFTA